MSNEGAVGLQTSSSADERARKIAYVRERAGRLANVLERWVEGVLPIEVVDPMCGELVVVARLVKEVCPTPGDAVIIEFLKRAGS